MIDQINLIDDEIPAHKKKSKKKGQPRSDHKHIYETVLLCQNYKYFDYNKNVHTKSLTFRPTKVCVICGRIAEVDFDSSYYVKSKVNGLPFNPYDQELSEKALSLQKWHTEDYWDKFAIKTED